MKRTAKNELRAKSAADLAKQAAELRAELFKSRVAQSVEGKGIGGKKRQLRRQIARLETFINQQRQAAAAKAAK